MIQVIIKKIIFTAIKMSKVVETNPEDLKKFLGGGVDPKTEQKRQGVLNQFKGFCTTKTYNFDELIQNCRDGMPEGKKKLETTIVEYLAGLRVYDKKTKTMDRPKVSTVDLKRSFLKTELSKLTGMEFSSKTAFPTLAAGTTGVKRQLKKEGRGDVKHHKPLPQEALLKLRQLIGETQQVK